MIRTYRSIQYLRAIAALSVVFGHAHNPQPWLYDPIAGINVDQAGVDVFFVISGFIMYSAAKDESVTTFAERRFVRIVPTYWFATLFTLLGSLLLHGSLVQSGGTVENLLKSLLFIPYFTPRDMNAIWPYLVCGWTLNYEMFFYIIFGIGLLSRNVLRTVTMMIVMLTALGFIFHIHDAIWLTYTNPLLLEFLGGLLVARYWMYLARPATMMLLPLGLLGLAFSGVVSAPRMITWGLPALAIVMGALAVETSGRLPRIRSLKVLGDASYPIYLFQIAAIAVASRIVERLPLGGPIQLLTMVMAAIACSVALGLAVHYGFERPILRALTSRRSARGYNVAVST